MNFKELCCNVGEIKALYCEVIKLTEEKNRLFTGKTEHIHPVSAVDNEILCLEREIQHKMDLITLMVDSDLDEIQRLPTISSFHRAQIQSAIVGIKAINDWILGTNYKDEEAHQIYEKLENITIILTSIFLERLFKTKERIERSCRLLDAGRKAYLPESTSIGLPKIGSNRQSHTPPSPRMWSNHPPLELPQISIESDIETGVQSPPYTPSKPASPTGGKRRSTKLPNLLPSASPKGSSLENAPPRSPFKR